MTESHNGGSTMILNGTRPEGRRLAGTSHSASSNLADLLERVLDKGIIIAGDITLCLGEIELLQIKVRLLIASVDRARLMGIDWWQHDPALSSAAQKTAAERDELAQRLDRLETMLSALVQERTILPAPADTPAAPAEGRSAPADTLADASAVAPDVARDGSHE